MFFFSVWAMRWISKFLNSEKIWVKNRRYCLQILPNKSHQLEITKAGLQNSYPGKFVKGNLPNNI